MKNKRDQDQELHLQKWFDDPPSQTRNEVKQFILSKDN